MTIFVCANTAEAQDTAGRCRQSRLPAFNAGAMNKEKGRHSMPHNERCREPDNIGDKRRKKSQPARKDEQAGVLID